MRRICTTVVIAMCWLTALASPASAHSVSGVGASNYRTRLRAVTPATPDITVKVVEAGSRLEVQNRGSTDLVVLGYVDEPYLRIGPDGVFANTRSPATYLNATRKGGTVPPDADADAKAEPVWKKVSPGNVARWHDHRIHWMGNQLPPQVRRAPGRTHVLLPKWTVTMQRGATTITASGDLTWVPGPSPFPWYLLALVLAAAVAATAFLRQWRIPLAIAVLAIVVVDAVHAFGIAFANAGGTGQHLAKLVSGNYLSVLAWLVGLGAVVLLLRDHPDAPFPAAFAAFVAALAGGLADIGALSKSQVPFAWSVELARFLVATSLGLGVGVVIAAVLAIRRTLPASGHDGDEPGEAGAVVAPTTG